MVLPVMSADNCIARESFGPGLPSALMMPCDGRVNTEFPLAGSSVAKRWSNERPSPTITMTCLMGVTCWNHL